MTRPLHVAVFAYNRPEHLRRCLTDLAANPEAAGSHVRIFVDGPKPEADDRTIKATVEMARGASGFASTEVVARGANLGLAQSIITGVGEMIGEFGEVVVLEDDLRLSPFFLRYMKEALDLYRECPEVFSIHGYTYPVGRVLPETFFLRGADCWGWATWERAWRAFDPDATSLVQRLAGERRVFDLDGAYPFTRMLEDNSRGLNDSWAIRWHASVFLRHGLTLYPGRSLAWNGGLDGSGVHSGDLELHAWDMSATPINVAPIPLTESQDARHAFATYLRTMRRRQKWMRVATTLGFRGSNGRVRRPSSE